MAEQSVDQRRGNAQRTRPLPLLTATLMLGFAAGAAISFIAFYLARYGPMSDGWSFRGNGALAAYTLVPAALAAGWSAAVFRFRGRADWLLLAASAGLIGLVLALGDAILLPVFGRGADQALGPILLVAPALWAVAAPLAALRFPASPRPGTTPAAVSAASAGLWLVGMVGGLGVIGLLFPAGS